jgi:hypothetical protein
MKFLIILAVIAGALYYFVPKAVDAFGMGTVEEATANLYPDSNIPLLPDNKPGTDAISSGIARSLAPVALDKGNHYIQSYTFCNRLPPDVVSLEDVEVYRDLDTRTIIVKGSQKDVTLAMLAIQSMDKPADSCEVRTWAVYVDRSLGNGYDLTAAIKSVSGADFSLAVAPGVSTFSLTGPDLAAALDIIADGSAVDVLQRPHLTLLHGQLAEVDASSEVPLPEISTTGTGVQQSGIVYRKVGLRLVVDPYFLGRDRVRLKVTQENGLIGPTVSVADGVSAPIIETQRVSSSVEIAIGECVVLGGVATERVTHSKGLLRDITERNRGLLYVVLATSHLHPKALPVPSLNLLSPSSDVPFSAPMSPANHGLDDVPSVLPPAVWFDDQIRKLDRLTPRGYRK